MPVEAPIPIAVIFPGQGSQYVGMGQKLFDNFSAARQIYEEANDALHYDVARLCFIDPEGVLNQTEFTQPAIVTTSVAALRVLEIEEGLYRYQVAGHSLGEFSALVAAEAITFAAAVKLVEERGKAMAQAGRDDQNEPTGVMKVILGLSEAEVDEICRNSGAEVANINAPGQIVIAGKIDLVELAVTQAKGKGGKIRNIEVSIASHCSLMEPARQQLQMVLTETEIHDPKKPFVANLTGKYAATANEVRRGLVDQVTNRVRWVDSVQTLVQNGVTKVVQVAPGEVVLGLIKKIDPGIIRMSYGN